MTYSGSIQVYQLNHRQSHASKDKAGYLYWREKVRRLKRHSPTHTDVIWFQDSLGMEPYRTDVTIREAYDWAEKRWYEAGRLARPRSLSCLRIAVNGPVGKLP